MIQNGDHLCHFGQSLTETYSSQVWSDVVLHVGDGSGRQLKTHRVVLASISDFLSSLLTRHSSFGAEEEVVHLTLAEMDFESVKIILGFAYDGEAKIPRTSVEAVCEVANELRVKYLKDSFVKVNQKEYQEIRAGRKSLKSIGGSSPQPLQGVMGSPGGARSSSPSKRVAGKPTPSGGVKSPSSKKVKKEKLSESDTDSADSDDETHRIAAESQASGAAGKFNISRPHISIFCLFPSYNFSSFHHRRGRL